MSRKTLIRSSSLPYHVNARTNNKERFHPPMRIAWRIFDYHLFEIHLLFGAQIHAFVLMPNHFHLLITTPYEDLGIVMQHFMSSVTRSLNKRSGRSGRAFGARYHWTLIDSYIYYSHALKYVYRNPVKAKLSRRVENYKFSSLNGLIGSQHLGFPLYFPFGKQSYEFIPDKIEEQLFWLNKAFKEGHDRGISQILKKTLFHPPKRGWDKELKELASGLI